MAHHSTPLAEYTAEDWRKHGAEICRHGRRVDWDAEIEKIAVILRRARPGQYARATAPNDHYLADFRDAMRAKHPSMLARCRFVSQRPGAMHLASLTTCVPAPAPGGTVQP